MIPDQRVRPQNLLHRRPADGGGEERAVIQGREDGEGY